MLHFNCLIFLRVRKWTLLGQTCKIFAGSIVSIDVLWVVFLSAFESLPVARDKVGRYMQWWFNGLILGVYPYQ